MAKVVTSNRTQVVSMRVRLENEQKNDYDTQRQAEENC